MSAWELGLLNTMSSRCPIHRTLRVAKKSTVSAIYLCRVNYIVLGIGWSDSWKSYLNEDKILVLHYCYCFQLTPQTYSRKIKMLDARILIGTLCMIFLCSLDVVWAQTTVSISATASHPVPSTLCKFALAINVKWDVSDRIYYFWLLHSWSDVRGISRFKRGYIYMTNDNSFPGHKCMPSKFSLYYLTLFDGLLLVLTIL